MFFNLAGTAMGVLASALWVGGMFIVWAAGLLAERVSLQLGFITIVTASAAAFVVFLFKYKTFIRDECTSSGDSEDAAKPTECYSA
jgi:dipeptide/tripeptide permease